MISIETFLYGDVYQGIYKPRKEVVAVKFAKKSAHTIINEAIIGTKLKGHPNVIELYGVVFSDFLQLIFQYMDQGDLYNLLKTRAVSLTTELGLDFMKQIASGLDFIHGIPVVHGDIARVGTAPDGTGYYPVGSGSYPEYSHTERTNDSH